MTNLPVGLTKYLVSSSSSSPDHRLDHVFDQILPDLLLRRFRIVLSGDQDRIDSLDLVAVIFHRNLGLAVRSQIWQRSVLSDLCQPSASLWASEIGIGISSGVSLQA